MDKGGEWMGDLDLQLLQETVKPSIPAWREKLKTLSVLMVFEVPGPNSPGRNLKVKGWMITTLYIELTQPYKRWCSHAPCRATFPISILSVENIVAAARVTPLCHLPICTDPLIDRILLSLFPSCWHPISTYHCLINLVFMAHHALSPRDLIKGSPLPSQFHDSGGSPQLWLVICKACVFISWIAATNSQVLHLICVSHVPVM